MRNSIFVLFLLSASAGAATAQTVPALYGSADAAYLAASASGDFLPVGMLFGHRDFPGTEDSFGLAKADRPYASLVDRAPFASPFRWQPDDALRRFRFQTGYRIGPIDTAFAYRDASDISGRLLSRDTVFGGAYTFAGGIRLGSLYRMDRTDLLPEIRDTREWLLGVSAPFGANTFMASYIRHINKTMSNMDSSRFSLGYAYTLSKQTDFYTSFSHQFGEGRPQFYAPGDGTNFFNAGIRHQF